MRKVLCTLRMTAYWAVAFGFASPLAIAQQPANPALRMAINVQPLSAAPPINASGDDLHGPGVAEDAVNDAMGDWRAGQRPAASGPFDQRRSEGLRYRFTAPLSPNGLGFSFEPRADVRLGQEGGQVRSAGAEVRLGEFVGAHEKAPTWDRPAWYLYAASDGSALTWTPEMLARGAPKGVRYQEDRVVVGDHQIGLSVEAQGVQGSIAVLNRNVGNGQVSRDENYFGASITMRH